MKMITVYRSQGMLGAAVAKSKLESAGVPVMLKYESYGQVLGLTVDGLGLVEVQVPEDWAEDATAMLDDSGNDEGPESAAESGDEMPGEEPGEQA
jgi:hypothetical protein